MAWKEGLDRCWLTRNHLMHWEKMGWSQRGLGLKFQDGLSLDEENTANFSLKAYYGATRRIKGLEKILNEAKEEFAIHSARWQKRREGSVTISAEWYSNGKATINRASDVDEALISVAEMANRYADSLKEATDIRDNTMGAFELDFSLEKLKDILNLNMTISTPQYPSPHPPSPQAPCASPHISSAPSTAQEHPCSSLWYRS